jgi:protein-tyrosine phosphatase
MGLDCSEIISNRLWVGRFVQPQYVDLLKHMEITMVLSLQSDMDLSMWGISARQMNRAYDRAGIDSRRIPVPDFSPELLAAHLPECVDEIHEAMSNQKARIYLHCTAGINRAPTAAAAYLMRWRGLSAEEAYGYLTARRECRPYIEVLKQYEQTLNQGGVSLQGR